MNPSKPLSKTPRPPAANGILISRDGVSFGPYSKAQTAEMVRDGIITPLDLAWRTGLEDWQPLFTLGIKGCTLPTQPVTLSHGGIAAPNQRPRKRGLGTVLLFAGIIFCIIAFNQGENSYDHSLQSLIASTERRRLEVKAIQNVAIAQARVEGSTIHPSQLDTSVNEPSEQVQQWESELSYRSDARVVKQIIFFIMGGILIITGAITLK
jgi:hypothetical protein